MKEVTVSLQFVFMQHLKGSREEERENVIVEKKFKVDQFIINSFQNVHIVWKLTADC